MHGIMSSIAEFYSRNLVTEVTKGLTQKLAQGGTPMRAPVGYLNVRKTDEQGREIRTVEVDPERAPLIRWAFETYAKGETSVTGLLRDLIARGLTTVPSPKRPSKPLGKNTLYKLLTNPYYAGVIRYKGALHPGAHEPLIEPALFDQVQSLLKARNARMARHVTHAHHLKGLLHCGSCGCRMLLDFATNPRGTIYAYFICSGRAAKKTICTRRAVPVQVAERLVEDSYRDITISEDDYRHLAAEVDAAFDEQSAGRDREFADLTANRARLEAESDKLLAAHFADAIDLPTLKRHQDRVRTGLADIEQRLSEHDEHHAGARAFLHDSLRLLADAHRAYAHSDDGNRRLANQAFYTRLEITDDEQLRPRLAEPFKTIVTEAMSAAAGKEAKREHSTSSDVTCSRKTLWVELRGLEPLTPCLQSRCATNCAIAPQPRCGREHMLREGLAAAQRWRLSSCIWASRRGSEQDRQTAPHAHAAADLLRTLRWGCRERLSDDPAPHRVRLGRAAAGRSAGDGRVAGGLSGGRRASRSTARRASAGLRRRLG